METDLSIAALILHASPLVKGVMLLLLVASVASWTVIFRKWVMLKRAKQGAERFEDRFWSGTDLMTLYNEVEGDDKPEGMKDLFVAGFREFLRIRDDRRRQNADGMDSLRRAMHVQMVREVDVLESEVPFLATVGSISPYVGLFGTVWGIMNSFIGLGGVQQATLAMVAPGIAEALIATAMGLFAAIPAVIAYNAFSNRVNRLEVRYETFVDEFSHILERHVEAGADPEQV